MRTSLRAHFLFGALCVSSILSICAEPLGVQLPQETAAFKQGKGAEIANAQCLICHSADYVSIQPPLPRAFWAGSIQKMQQKYGAVIPPEQIEPLTDYLVKQYGQAAPNVVAVFANEVKPDRPSVPPGAAPATDRTAELAVRYGCIGCHNVSMKFVGPGIKEIAEKYRSDVDAVKKVSDQITHGGAGKWGSIPMPPFPQINPSEAEILSRWILNQR